jgi:hypothetical protein
MTEHLYNFSLAEEREHYASLLDFLRQSLTFGAIDNLRRRPRSPSLNHNVKQQRLDDIRVYFQAVRRFATIAAKQRGGGL